MNRRQKIIVSVTGIFIVLLALVGLTYAYFLTRIQGNTSDKSISVTTANLALTYGENTPNILMKSAITPGMEIGTKEFTVTNTGDDSSYVVVLENVLVKYASDGTKLDGTVYREGEITSFNRPQDFVYTLTCETNKSDTTCDGLTETVFPSKDGIVIGNEIKKGDVHSYTLTLTYKYENVDQSDDMNKTLEAKVNIKDIKEYNPYEKNKKSLAYNIINNAALNKNGTELLTNPKTNVAEEINSTDESVLTQSADDFGISYYYRGAVENNYVNFAGMCWRVVRIAGDGTTKLILEDQDQLCNSKDSTNNFNMDGNWDIPLSNEENALKKGNYGYTSDSEALGTGWTDFYIIDYLNQNGIATNYEYSMATAFKNFQQTKLSNYLSDLESGGWCFSDDAYENPSENLSTAKKLTEMEKFVLFDDMGNYYYDSYIRLVGNTPKEQTLKCTGQLLDKWGDNVTPMYVGALTADEVTYAGDVYGININSNYLVNNYQKENKLHFWTLTPAYLETFLGEVFSVVCTKNGCIFTSVFSGNEQSFRPVINLIENIEIINGDGTQENPYAIG